MYVWNIQDATTRRNGRMICTTKEDGGMTCIYEYGNIATTTTAPEIATTPHEIATTAASEIDGGTSGMINKFYFN